MATRADMVYRRKEDSRYPTGWHRSVLIEFSSFLHGLRIAKLPGPVGALREPYEDLSPGVGYTSNALGQAA